MKKAESMSGSMAGWSRRSFLGRGACAFGALSPALRAVSQGMGAMDEVVVKTPLGVLRGMRSNGVRVFKGVPFAQPPVGDLRFRPTEAVKSWSGVRGATKFAAAAVQQDDRDVPQSEDCLALNIWTPEMQRGADGVHGAGKLPVFVWIHGGGFTGGEAFAPIFDGTVFARQGVVVVTVAYRLGVLGFLDLEPLLGQSYAGSANNAVRDLMTALGWVQTNIEAFGGDPQRVTIGGESAGAKLTCLLMGVPAARPLFHGMISESGGAERIWPKANALKVAEGFGKKWVAKTGQPVSAMKTAEARQLIEVQASFTATWPQHFPLRCELDGQLFPELPVHTMGKGSVAEKRLLIGTNRDESALFLGPHPQHDPLASDLGNMSVASFRQVYEQYASVYPEMTEEQRRIRATTAEEYWVPSVRVADAACHSKAEVWMYELDFARDSGRYKGYAFHSEDVGLVWDKPSREGESAKNEAALATTMNGAWAAFIKGEAPAAAGLPAWTAYNPQTRPTMMLDTTSRVEERPQARELALWKDKL